MPIITWLTNENINAFTTGIFYTVRPMKIPVAFQVELVKWTIPVEFQQIPNTFQWNELFCRNSNIFQWN